MSAASVGIKKKKRDVNMTEGGILRHLILFAIPLLLGNLFQQLYNTVDTWVVGNFVSNEAYSAVGSVNPIINTLIGFFMGFSSGAGVVISQYYGARKEGEVRKTVHTAILVTLVMSVVFAVVGILVSPAMLRMMKTPAEVIPESQTYLNIYFAGIIGMMVYNIGSGILRAVGDSKRPFYFLVVSALLNTALDLLFVIRFGMGVAGVALATVIAQCVSAVLVLITLARSETCVQFRVKELAVHWGILKQIVRIGIPAALQLAITSFSNVFVQSYVNYFGQNAMSGWTSFSKVDQFILLPRQSLALAATTFVGQNLGSGKVERARKGVHIAFAISLATTVLPMIPLMVFAPGVVGFFNSKPEVVEIGAQMLRCVMPFQVFGCLNQIYSGGLRGAGNSRAPMVIMLLSFVAFRQAYLFVMANFICNEIIPIIMGYPAGWLLCGLGVFIYFLRTDLSKEVLVEHKG